MRLSWNEIRARAADFAREWADATYEKGETQSFYNEFFDIFGVRRRTVARYEEHVRATGQHLRFHGPVLAGCPASRAKESGTAPATSCCVISRRSSCSTERNARRLASRLSTCPSTSRSSGSSSVCNAARSAIKILSTSRRPS